jgi:hypothetical protein
VILVDIDSAFPTEKRFTFLAQSLESISNDIKKSFTFSPKKTHTLGTDSYVYASLEKTLINWFLLVLVLLVIT